VAITIPMVVLESIFLSRKEHATDNATRKDTSQQIVQEKIKKQQD
jgi:hypothetical protein